MTDIFYCLLAVALFAGAALYVRACDALTR